MSEAKKPDTNEPQQARVPAGKRYALLRYMAIMFAVAFVLVLLSLIFESRGNDKSISELQTANSGVLARAEALQAENESLKSENETLKNENQALKDAAADQENLRRVYDALTYVLTTDPVEGDVLYSNAQTTLENLNGYLSDSAKEALAARQEALAAAETAEETQETQEAN